MDLSAATVVFIYLATIVLAFSAGWAIAEFKYRHKYKDWSTRRES